MSQPRQTADEMTTAGDRRDVEEVEYDDQASARGREADYGETTTVAPATEEDAGRRTDDLERTNRSDERTDDFQRMDDVERADTLDGRTDRVDERTDDFERTDDLGDPRAESSAGLSQEPGAARDDEPSRAPSDGKLAPGQAANDPVAALWGGDLVDRYRSKWRDLQLTFVDDPQRATHSAASLVDDAVSSLTATLQAQKQSLDGWQATRADDTEVMRVALRNYRDFLDRLLGL
jgi:hypothetical protein